MGRSLAPFRNCLASGKKHKMIHEFGQGCHCANCGIHCGENPQLHHEQIITMTSAEIEAHIPTIEVSRSVNNAFHVR